MASCGPSGPRGGSWDRKYLRTSAAKSSAVRCQEGLHHMVYQGPAEPQICSFAMVRSKVISCNIIKPYCRRKKNPSLQLAKLKTVCLLQQSCKGQVFLVAIGQIAVATVGQTKLGQTRLNQIRLRFKCLPLLDQITCHWSR